MGEIKENEAWTKEDQSSWDGFDGQVKKFKKKVKSFEKKARKMRRLGIELRGVKAVEVDHKKVIDYFWGRL